MRLAKGIGARENCHINKRGTAYHHVTRGLSSALWKISYFRHQRLSSLSIPVSSIVELLVLEQKLSAFGWILRVLGAKASAYRGDISGVRLCVRDLT